MKLDAIAQEIRALKTIKNRWELRGWHFTPLERLDGENEVIESLYLLRNSPLCWPSFDRKALDSNTARLLDDLEELYNMAASPWREFRTVVDCESSQREYLRWPYGTYSAKIRKECRLRFWELVTTTRFSVDGIPNINELQQFNFPLPPLTARHLASIAAMVCVHDAIGALEQILSSWTAESRIQRIGKPFRWLVENDPGRLELILSELLLKNGNEREFYSAQVRDAWDSKKQGERWLAHLDILDVHEAELERSVEAAKVLTLAQLKSKQSSLAKRAASAPRKQSTARLTGQMVADYFKAHPQKYEVNISELAALHRVSESTVRRRYASAVEVNLIS